MKSHEWPPGAIDLCDIHVCACACSRNGARRRSNIRRLLCGWGLLLLVLALRSGAAMLLA